MTTLVAALLGAMFATGLSLTLLVARGREERDPESGAATPSRLRLRASSIDRILQRVVLAGVAALVVAVVTGWPVGTVLAGAGGFWALSVGAGRSGRAAAEARLEAIASWTEQLRDVMAAAAGLEQAILATAEHAPVAIRGEVNGLAAALEAGTSPRTALRRFAQRLDDPAGDLVVAALILAAEGSPRQLGELLGRLAETSRDTIRMRLRVDSGRARSRSSVRLVTTITVGFSVGIVVLNPTYVQAYRNPVGQLVLIVVASLFGGAYWWLARTSRDTITGRFLTAGASPVPLRPGGRR